MGKNSSMQTFNNEYEKKLLQVSHQIASTPRVHLSQVLRLPFTKLTTFEGLALLLIKTSKKF